MNEKTRTYTMMWSDTDFTRITGATVLVQLQVSLSSDELTIDEVKQLILEIRKGSILECEETCLTREYMAIVSIEQFIPLSSYYLKDNLEAKFLDFLMKRRTRL